MNQNAGEPEVKLIIPSHRKDRESTSRIDSRPSEAEEDELSEVLRKFFKRQANSVLPKLGAKSAEWWDEDRWNAELADDIAPVLLGIANRHGEDASKTIGFEYVKEITTAYLRKMAEGRAKAINATTQEQLEGVAEDEELEPAQVFEEREKTDSGMISKSLATAVSSWAVVEAVHQAQDNGFTKRAEKEWVTGPNPRLTHAAMNGQRVGIDDNFSNGARWPGDDNLDPDERCNCNCSTAVVITWED